MRIKRVGSTTCGISLIFFGILFLITPFLENIDYSFILHFWPIILIGLGVEMLAAVRACNKTENCTVKYDKGAVFLMIILLLFACCMGAGELCMKYMENYTLWY